MWCSPATPANIRSVARGDALRILEQYSSYRFSELTTIRRQKPKAFRQIVELAAAKQTDKAFAKLLELGAVTESSADGPQARSVPPSRSSVSVRRPSGKNRAARVADMDGN